MLIDTRLRARLEGTLQGDHLNVHGIQEVLQTVSEDVYYDAVAVDRRGPPPGVARRALARDQPSHGVVLSPRYVVNTVQNPEALADELIRVVSLIVADLLRDAAERQARPVIVVADLGQTVFRIHGYAITALAAR